MSNKKGLFALSPLFVFAAFYLVSSIAADDFYKVPLTVAFMFASIYAIAISGGFPLAKRVAMYSRGAGTDNLILMLWIFVMAGSFAQAAKDIGCVDATVNTILHALRRVSSHCLSVPASALSLHSLLLQWESPERQADRFPYLLLWSLAGLSLATTYRLSLTQPSQPPQRKVVI